MSVKEIFDYKTFIEEAEKRSPLHDFQLKEYNAKNIEIKLWNEVCAVVVRKWNVWNAPRSNLWLWCVTSTSLASFLL